MRNPFNLAFTKLKLLLRRIAPSGYDSVRERITRQRTNHVLRKLTSQFGWVVQAGPFVGMRYVPNSVGSTLPPKLLGSYELELHSAIEQILKHSYARVIDIGCAEGYYAVGLALKSSVSEIHAFDVNPEGLALCIEMARLNGVSSRVITHAECTHSDLGVFAIPGSLIICDCEGCELELLDPIRVPALRHCDLLIELHDVLRPGLTPELLARFKATHQIELINTQERDPNAYPKLRGFSYLNQRVAVAELRDGPMQWAFMNALVRPN